MKFRSALALTVALAALTGCPVPPAPSGSPSPSPTASPTAAPTASPTSQPTAPPSPPAVQNAKAGAASEAYVKAVAEVMAQGYDTWLLYQVRGDALGENGLATESNQVWQVYVYTPRDQKSWQISVPAGIGASISEVTQADRKYKQGQIIDTANWRIDTEAAVQAAGGRTTGTMILYSQEEFKAQTGSEATAPVWVVNTGEGAQAYINASTGAKL